jgi:hypothetical protein
VEKSEVDQQEDQKEQQEQPEQHPGDGRSCRENPAETERAAITAITRKTKAR